MMGGVTKVMRGMNGLWEYRLVRSGTHGIGGVIHARSVGVWGRVIEGVTHLISRIERECCVVGGGTMNHGRRMNQTTMAHSSHGGSMDVHQRLLVSSHVHGGCVAQGDGPLLKRR